MVGFFLYSHKTIDRLVFQQEHMKISMYNLKKKGPHQSSQIVKGVCVLYIYIYIYIYYI